MKIATRAAYGEALAELAEAYPQLVVLDADLSGSTMTKTFAAKYPERFFDMGIAEGNMAGVAAGLATCGKIPFINSFAMFSAGRAWEQVRNSIAYPGLNVKVIGSHGGLSVGEDGATHQCIEDYAIMRAIPGMLVLSPCDGPEMKLAVKALLDYQGPAYMRLGRLAVESVTDTIPGYTFALGKGSMLRDGTDATIIATGMMVQCAYEAAETLAAEGISLRVIDMHTIKPIDKDIVLKAAEETGCIITSEEANIIGGLGSAVAEVVSEGCPVPVVRHGVNDEFGRSGKAQAVLDAYKLNAQGIAEKVRYALTLKKEDGYRIHEAGAGIRTSPAGAKAHGCSTGYVLRLRFGPGGKESGDESHRHYRAGAGGKASFPRLHCAAGCRQFLRKIRDRRGLRRRIPRCAPENCGALH